MMGSSKSNGHICQCLTRILAFRRAATVTVSGGGRRTGEEFVEGVLGLARSLGELGVGRGDVVAIAALNSEWYLEWLLAVTYVGGIVSPLNYRWSLEEARGAVELVNPVMLVVDESCRDWASGLQSPALNLRVLIGEFPSIITGSGSVIREIKTRKPSMELPSFSYLWAPKDIALICFTSGTTGKPKGVAISHLSLIVQALAKIAIVGYNNDDVYLHTAPLCHIGGISSCITVLMAGGCHVLIPRFAAKEAIEVINQSRATSLITVPTMMSDLVSFIGRQNRWSGGEYMKKVLNGGGGLSQELISGAIHIFPNAKLISAYGMTETCSSLTFITLHDPTTKGSKSVSQNKNEVIWDSTRSLKLGGICVGKPPLHIELQIRTNGSEDSQPAPGRISTRGSHVMVGYWGHIAMEDSTTSSSNWIDTGDIGWIDASGNLWLLGRTKDRIKSGGENVYPEEVESVLLQHPGVSSVVVVGVPDHRLSEMVVACVFLEDGWKWFDEKDDSSSISKHLSSDILHRHCRQKNLTRFKIPKKYLLWKKSFPRTSTGKLIRDDVRMEAMYFLQFLPSNL